MTPPAGSPDLWFLIIAAIALGAGFFSRQRRPLARAAQAVALIGFMGAALWLLNARPELITHAANPATPQRLSVGSVALTRGLGGQFHAELTVNGAPVRFVVDTGATTVVLSQADARRIGLKPERLAYTRLTFTANGRTMSAPVRLREMRLAQFVDRNVPALVGGGEMQVSLLGMSYLSRFRKLSVEGRRMVLTR